MKVSKTDNLHNLHHLTFTLVVTIPQDDALLDDAVISKDTVHVGLGHKLGQLADEQFSVWEFKLKKCQLNRSIFAKIGNSL